jgi:hypothetical protein
LGHRTDGDKTGEGEHYPNGGGGVEGERGCPITIFAGRGVTIKRRRNGCGVDR